MLFVEDSLTLDGFLEAYLIDHLDVPVWGPDGPSHLFVTSCNKSRKLSDILTHLTTNRFDDIIERNRGLLNWSYWCSFRYGFRHQVPSQASTIMHTGVSSYSNSFPFDCASYQQLTPMSDSEVEKFLLMNPISWRLGNVNPESGPPQKGIYIVDGNHRALAVLNRIASGKRWIPLRNAHNPHGHCQQRFKEALSHLGETH